MFTIRIKPKKNECLTSYIYRFAQANKCKALNLIERVKMPGKKRVSKYTIPTLDFSPLDNYDMSKLALYTGLEEKQLLSLSISPFHSKFNHALNLLNREWETRYRKYCPCCLKEGDYFKIYWQVKEIKLCLLHKVKLRNSCNNCNYLLPYIDNNIILYKECPQCGASLKDSGEAADYKLDFINDQQRIYNDWIFLLSNNYSYQDQIYSLLESLTLKFLYFISLQNNIKEIPIPSFTGFCNTLINSIKTKKININRSVTPLNLLRTLRHYDVPIQEFFHLRVPENFIDSLISEPKKKEEKCLAYWCKSLGSSSPMIKAELHRSSYKYSNVSKCTVCNLTYGIERKTGKWENVDKLIEIYDILAPYLEGFIDIVQLLNNKEKVSEYRVYYLLGYLLNQSWFDTSRINITLSNSREKQDQLKSLLSLTKLIPQLKSLAEKNYGWDSLEFFYLYHSDVVQRYIYFGLRENRKKTTIDIWNKKVKEYLQFLLDTDIDITLDTVSRGVDCCPRTLNKCGLSPIIKDMKEKQRHVRILKQKEKYYDVIDDYICRCLEMDNKPNCREIYSLLGLTIATLKKNHLDIYEYIKTEVTFVNNKLHDNLLDNYKKLCKKSIQEIARSGDSLSYSRILTTAGLGDFYCRSYPELRRYIDNEIQNYQYPGAVFTN